MKKVKQVYVGKADKCFCGCSGKWFDANNSDDLTGFLKGINKFNKLGTDFAFPKIIIGKTVISGFDEDIIRKECK